VAAPEPVELLVNGARRTLEVDPTAPLLFVLRNDLGLLSPKLGCGAEQCGACTVLVGGEAVPSCRLPVGSLRGREVVTLEGLAGPDGALHPLQRAFLEEQAAQCAFCVPGVVMAAAGLLAWNDAPGDEDLARALADHLCRCGAQPRMLRAIRRAAREMRGADGEATA
jgi:nicotinate dehydrogenase subunit A